MKPISSRLGHLQILAMLVVALALWISGVHGFMHHHHDDHRTHGDCASCQVLSSSVSLPCTQTKAAGPVTLTVTATGPVTQAAFLPVRLLRLRAPSTSPPSANA